MRVPMQPAPRVPRSLREALRAAPLAVAVLWGWVGVSVTSQPAPSAEDHFAALADPSYATREAAMDALLTDDELTPQTLADWVERATELEQRHRLLALARHHALRRQREAEFAADGPGSMGVIQVIRDLSDWPAIAAEADGQAGPAPGGGVLPREARACALVSEVLPGFPAAGRLRPGDRIIALDGRPIPGPANATLFERQMRQYFAGDPLRLTVLRGDATQEVTVPLTNGLGLAAMYRGSNHRLHEAYEAPWLETRDRLFAPLLTDLAPPPPPARRGPRAILDAMR